MYVSVYLKKAIGRNVVYPLLFYYYNFGTQRDAATTIYVRLIAFLAACADLRLLPFGSPTSCFTDRQTDRHTDQTTTITLRCMCRGLTTRSYNQNCAAIGCYIMTGGSYHKVMSCVTQMCVCSDLEQFLYIGNQHVKY